MRKPIWPFGHESRNDMSNLPQIWYLNYLCFFHHSHFVPKSGVPYLINMLIISMLSFCFEFNIHTLTFRKRIQQLFWVERPQSIVYILQKNPFKIGWSFLEIVQKMNVKKLKSFFFALQNLLYDFLYLKKQISGKQ